jgi:hypothetical protein
MQEAIEKLIRALRDELLEHGEMLALLEDQRASATETRRRTSARHLLAIHRQAVVIRIARVLREQHSRELARSLNVPTNAGFAQLVQGLTEANRLLLTSLLEQIILCHESMLRRLPATAVI